MLNRIVLQGRLVRDPEIRYTQSNIPVANFALAVQRNYSDKDNDFPVDFIPCVAWGKRANFVQDFFHKGQMMLVDGRLETRKWQDKHGSPRTAFEVNVDVCQFGEPRREEKPPLSEEPPYMTPSSADDDGFTETEDGNVPW